MSARRLLVALTLLALAAGVVAFADAKNAATAPAQARVGLLRASADYLGLTPQQLRTELQSGKSLAQVAAARNKPVQGLRQVVIEALRARIETAVASGRLTRERANALLARVETRVDRLLNRTWTARDRAAKRGNGLVGAAATYLGLTPQQLRTELQSGKSLAQVATAQGRSVEGLKQALLAALRAKVNRAVADGRITAAQAERLLERAPSRIDRLVNRTRR